MSPIHLPVIHALIVCTFDNVQVCIVSRYEETHTILVTLFSYREISPYGPIESLK
jgi:hypothetical protein